MSWERSEPGPPRPHEWMAPAPASEPAPAGETLAQRADEGLLEPLGPVPGSGRDARRPARVALAAGALLGLAALALVLVALAVRGDGDDRGPVASTPAWSDWKPRDGAGAGERQIAEHVGAQYFGEDGKPLVRLEAGGMEIERLPLAVAIRLPPSAGGQVKVFDDKGVLYRMCGTGQGCPALTGAPSVERHHLLRREALELALYSFRYLDGVQQVAVLLPPPPGRQAGQAVFFRRPQVGPELRKPLDVTLTPRAPSVAGATRNPDALLVQQLTVPTLFTFGLTRDDRQRKAFLVLDPLATPENYGVVPPGSGGGGRGAPVPPVSSGGTARSA